MLIKDARVKVKKFKEVKVGDIIRFADEANLKEFTYMVISDCHDENGDYANLACLDDGSFYYADDEECVEVLNAELVIKS